MWVGTYLPYLPTQIVGRQLATYLPTYNSKNVRNFRMCTLVGTYLGK